MKKYLVGVREVHVNTIEVLAESEAEGVPASGRWKIVGGGCCHEDIARAFPEMAHLIPWHLVDDDGTPLHYLSNGDYWMRKHLGVFRIFAHSEKEGRRPGEPEPLAALKDTIVFGVLDFDELVLAAVLATETPRPATIPELAELPEDRKALAVSLALRAWLASRLPLLYVAMESAMIRASVEYIQPEETV